MWLQFNSSYLILNIVKLQLVCYWTMIGGVSRQMEAWREGFDSVFPSSSLKMFYPEELEMVFCGANQVCLCINRGFLISWCMSIYIIYFVF